MPRLRPITALRNIAVYAAFCALWVTSPAVIAAQLELRVIRDIPYVSGGDPRLQTLDLYLPTARANFPLIFLVHGGGLTRGDKLYDGFENYVNYFVREGIGVASANYRLLPAVQHPTPVEDVAKAFAWLYGHAGEYQVDRNRIFIQGHSAGGYLVSLLALDKKYLANVGLAPQVFRGVITTSGVYEEARDTGREAATALVGRDPQLPPWLITRTDRDLQGMAEQAQKFYALFLKHDFPVRMAVITDRTHIAQIGGVGRPLPRVPGPGVEAPVRAVADDTLGPAILRFVDDVVSGRPLSNQLLKAKAPPLRTVKDLPYSSASNADAKLNSLDLYLPQGKSNAPVVLFFHGGGWRNGDKAAQGFDGFVETFAKIGVAVAAANYRLAPSAKFPAQIQDAAKALAWLNRHGAEYGIDPDRIFVAGHSAGAHLASLLALDTHYLQAEGLSPGAIRGVLSLNGIYDVPAFSEIGAIPSAREQTFADQSAMEAASPVRHVSRQAPPFLIVFAEHDLYGLREQAMDFYSALLHQGLKPQLAQIPGRAHVTTLTSMGRPLDGIDDLAGPTAVEFVEKILAGSAITAQAR